MREDVERVADAALRIDGVAQLLARSMQRDDARDVGLPTRAPAGRYISLMCSSNVVGHAGRRVGQRRDPPHDCFARLLDAPLDLADVVEILIEPASRSAGRQLLLKRRHLAHHRVEQATRLLTARAALARRCCRRRTAARTPPAGCSPSAAATSASATRSCSRYAQLKPSPQLSVDFLDRQLQRRQRRVLADVLRRDLIDRDRRDAACGPASAARRSGTPRPSACGSRRPNSPPVRLRMAEIADDVHLRSRTARAAGGSR